MYLGRRFTVKNCHKFSNILFIEDREPNYLNLICLMKCKVGRPMFDVIRVHLLRCNLDALLKFSLCTFI